MPLRRLTALETDKLRQEYEDLQATISDLKSILDSEERRRAILSEQALAARRAETGAQDELGDTGELSDIDYGSPQEVRSSGSEERDGL